MSAAITISILGAMCGLRNMKQIHQWASNEKIRRFPAVRELLELLEIEGCLVVADALNCQKETAQKIIENKGSYLLSVKDNQLNLKSEIADYVMDPSLQKTMDKVVKREKNRDRIETRIAYTICEIDWLFGREEWPALCCIGAINTQFEPKKARQTNGISTFQAVR